MEQPYKMRLQKTMEARRELTEAPTKESHCLQQEAQKHLQILKFCDICFAGS